MRLQDGLVVAHIHYLQQLAVGSPNRIDVFHLLQAQVFDHLNVVHQLDRVEHGVLVEYSLMMPGQDGTDVDGLLACMVRYLLEPALVVR